VIDKNARQRKNVERLLSESARLRRTSEELVEDAKRLRARIAAETKGRLAERRTRPRLKGK
jgi:hypothetical protein